MLKQEPKPTPLPDPPPIPVAPARASTMTRVISWFIPNLTAFMASFCIMVLELVAGRVLARYLGSSLYTWTSVIGIVLAGITIGNLVGGRLADWFRPQAVLAVLFLLAAGACLITPVVNEVVNKWPGWTATLEDVSWFVWILHRMGGGEIPSDPSSTLQMPWSAHIFGHVLLVFLLPSTLLGTIGPLVAKMALDQGRRIGATVGNVYGWGALGSIAGTFVTGFYLIAKLGTEATILLVGVLLGVIGLLYCFSLLWRSPRPGQALVSFLSVSWAVGFPLLAVWFVLHKWGFFEGKTWRFEWVDRGDRVVLREWIDPEGDIRYVDESDYSYIKVESDTEKGEEGEEKETRRELVLDNLIHAYFNQTDPTELHYDYEGIYKALTHRFMPPGAADAAGGNPNQRMKALFIGGGGYVFPRYLRAVWPSCRVEVAEIDPAVTAADIAAFGLPAKGVQIVKTKADLKREDNPYWVYHMDARNHVEDLVRRKDSGEPIEFDFIYGDAFNDYAVPFHLTTEEFTASVKKLLSARGGIYMINIIDIFNIEEVKKEGRARFLGAVYNTFRAAFQDNVYVYCCNKDEPSTSRDTYIVVGSLKPLDLDGLPGDEEPYKFLGSRLTEEHLKKLTSEAYAGQLTLTDDYAPVENLLQYVVNSRKW